MLSLSNVGSGATAASYYDTADDYYTGDRSPSVWWGRSAELLGLAGPVEPELLAQLLEGRLPSGEQLHSAAAGRRGGTDATFSAPKSISLQALVGGDVRLVESHQRAVDRALAYAQLLAACRVTEAGKTVAETTGNLLVARFEHDLSRACDPQLHTHCVLINATQRADGQWRALNNEAIYRHKMLLGALYRAELAREVQQLGYEVRLTHVDGRFELAHISEQQVRAFSQRSAQIEEHLQLRGQVRDEASAWDKKLAAVITREKKSSVDRNVLSQEWKALSREHGISYAVPDMPVQSLTVRSGVEVGFDGESIRLARDAIMAESVAHLSERHAVFGHMELMRQALERGVGAVTLDELQVMLEQAEQTGLLIRSGERYTTLAAQKQETEVLAMEVQGRGTKEPIYKGDRAALQKDLAGLTHEQQSAAQGVLLSRHQVLGIQGRAGVGKTTLLSKTAALVKACGYRVEGLAPSASAARELASTGMTTQTIAAFAARANKGLTPNTLLVLDEAGMASSAQMQLVLQAATDAGCRVVLLGDTAQLAAVEAGKPFAQLQANGMATALVGQIQRQQNPQLKQAVELAVSGQVALAVELLDKEITQIVQASERHQRIAADYVALSLHERARTRVIAGTRHARSEVNRAIRERLGMTSQVAFTLLTRKDLTKAARRSTLSYQVGDVVQAEIDYPSLGLKRGEFAHVVARPDHRVMLERADGVRVVWQPAVLTRLGVFVPEVQALALGDLVRVTANDRARGLVNGDLATIVGLGADGDLTAAPASNVVSSVRVQLADGRQVLLDGTKPLLLDYGYCSTVHSAQGQTCDRVLIDADVNSLTANRSTFYVAISRARQMAKIYTDDHEMLPLAMSREPEREAALELAAERDSLVLGGASE